MKKLIFVLLVLSMLFPNIHAFAGKPTPPPYPQSMLEGDAYIPPEQQPGLPGVSDPTFPTVDPRFGVPYVWGIFIANDGKRRVFVTIDMDWPMFDMRGEVCIMSTAAPYAVSCFDLHPRYYNGETGVTTFTSDEVRHCGRFIIQAADLDNIPADIREPNLYVLTCIFLPWLRRFIY